MASDEGFMLARYGVQGVHWDMKDGKPVANQEWFDKFSTDTNMKSRKNEGISIGLESLTGLDRINSAREETSGRNKKGLKRWRTLAKSSVRTAFT